MLAAACAAFSAAQSSRMTREEYILMYKDVAVAQMLSSGIPASITMAQACLESGNGNSRLAVEGNNHFGIKCHGWAGDSINIDDDAKAECFRKYESADQSFSDHSDFLRYRDRYASLFELDREDYKGWALGLKAAGYATSPTYAENLIRIIEENGLAALDRIEDEKQVELPPAPAVAEAPERVVIKHSSPLYEVSLHRKIFRRNGSRYVLAESYDSFASLAEEFHLFKKEIMRFNDCKEERKLKPGEPVYIERKRNSSARHLEKHFVEEGETMPEIAQRYAVRLKALYRYNNLEAGTEPAAGTIIKLTR